VNSTGKIYKISVSPQKGTKKTNIDNVVLVKDFGIIGDAHAGSHRQISLLPIESFDKLENDIIKINPGDFAENITTIGIEFNNFFVGRRIKIGKSIELEITQIGKECHQGCYIKETVGNCIMPMEGVFAKVINGGDISVGDAITWIE
jgi:MOSC domain-containing protein YiiM